MTSFKHVLFMVTVLGLSSADAEANLPDFYQHPLVAGQEFNGVPETVDLLSYKGAKKYRTKLEEGARKGPNFAGHYTVVTIGCGTQCQENWVIDARTGKILEQFPSVIDVSYQLDSNLMIINPLDPDLERGYKTHPEAPFWNDIQTRYVLWKNHKFAPLYENKWVNIVNSMQK